MESFKPAIGFVKASCVNCSLSLVICQVIFDAAEMPIVICCFKVNWLCKRIAIVS